MQPVSGCSNVFIFFAFIYQFVWSKNIPASGFPLSPHCDNRHNCTVGCDFISQPGGKLNALLHIILIVGCNQYFYFHESK